MTLAEVMRRIEYIKSVAGDDERAHSKEDDLHQDVLHNIANGTAESPQEMARLALTTSEIEFYRWCA